MAFYYRFGLMKNYLFKFHEWAADHFEFVQYPNIRPLNVQSRTLSPLRKEQALKVASIAGRSILCFFVLVIGLPALYILLRVFRAIT